MPQRKLTKVPCSPSWKVFCRENQESAGQPAMNRMDLCFSVDAICTGLMWEVKCHIRNVTLNILFCEYVQLVKFRCVLCYTEIILILLRASRESPILWILAASGGGVTEQRKGPHWWARSRRHPFPVSCWSKRCRQTGGDLNTLSCNSFTLSTNPDGAQGSLYKFVGMLSGINSIKNKTRELF